MKIAMNKNGEGKGGSSSRLNGSRANSKLRVAIYGQHDVGKSAFTVRYLTKRYIGEYKSNTDLLYRQTLAISHGSSLDIEIVDISTSFVDGAECIERKTFPLEELYRADGFIIVYSITDRSSFDTAMQALSDIQKIHNIYKPPTSENGNSSSTSASSKSGLPVHVTLIANKCDLVHVRQVDRLEGVAAAEKFGCQFYELSVAENSPEVYSSFHSIITSLIATNVPPPKRKFSVSKMLASLRLGKNSPSNASPVPIAPASIADTNVVTNDAASFPNSPAGSREGSPGVSGSSKGAKHERQGSGDSTSSFTSSICQLKSKLVVFNSMKKRQSSPPICSL
ncbi:ras-related and estrogen-regulated growth inhibitor-like protein [Folsomia candida]|uniref:small monomeric GTPase n=1 Tax=Folsomia candida TaxID=158441 RepID=A0A226D4D1_FOLCA|nr:ras-related and estrogen-regulated growth inhibitor-like protein [Folsomia candida]OXA40412.1 Ras-related and estrogen-regulated growth inhibitor-like protein [Folsomia candida]